MKEALTELLLNIAKLFKVKSVITIALTGVLIAMLVGAFEPAQEFVALFCTSYGAIITYFFTRKDSESITYEEKDSET